MSKLQTGKYFLNIDLDGLKICQRGEAWCLGMHLPSRLEKKASCAHIVLYFVQNNIRPVSIYQNFILAQLKKLKGQKVPEVIYSCKALLKVKVIMSVQLRFGLRLSDENLPNFAITLILENKTQSFGRTAQPMKKATLEERPFL